MRERENYNVGIYCRLSKDDLIHNVESSSISTQKTMITKFVHEQFWFIYDFYIDDGWSGTNFERPAFQRMLEDINSGYVNMVVVKDLSRLGRNYIQTGQYTDIIFPDKDVRFIAIDDGIDTLKSNNDITPFKNILNEMYAKDISKKVRSAVRTKKQNGDFLSNYSPYGYKKHPDKPNILIPDELPAVIVKKIFKLYISGVGSTSIAKVLTNDHVLPPLEYRKKQLGQTFNAEKPWSANSVLAILKNRIYVGDMVQGIYECSQFRRMPAKKRPQEEWIITPNTHEALVEKSIWEQVQQGIREHQPALGSCAANSFFGFLQCGQCGHSMSYSIGQGNEYYCCRFYRKLGRKGCTSHRIEKTQLEQIVLNDIKNCASWAVSKHRRFLHLLNFYHEKDKEIPKDIADNLAELRQRHSQINKIIKNLYEDKVNKTITAKRFSILLKSFEEEQGHVDAKINKILQEISEIKNKPFDPAGWLKIIAKYEQLTPVELTREVLTELIEKIIIDEKLSPDGAKSIHVTIHYHLVGAIDKSIYEKLL